jgi:hypothetical protein
MMPSATCWAMAGRQGDIDGAQRGYATQHNQVWLAEDMHGCNIVVARISVKRQRP